MHLPEQSTYEQPPAGTHAATCIAFIDLGTQPNEYQGETSMKHQVLIRWELPDELMEDGRPFTIGQFYTWSMSDKAKLRQHLESWRGKPFEREDFGPNGRFSTKNLLGKPCTLGVIINERGNARVSSVGPKMKSVEAKPQINESIYLALTPQDFEPSILGKLSEKMQAMIKASPEYRNISASDAGDIPAGDDNGSFDDPIPF